MSREAFDLELGRMAVLPGMPGDSDAYWEVLCDIPDDLFKSAIGHALRTRKWFPVPVELRDDVEAVKPRTYYTDRNVEPRPVSFTATITNPLDPSQSFTVNVVDHMPHECEACSDTGWVSFWCGPVGPRMGTSERLDCERRGQHVAHEYVRPCPCIGTNPVIQRKRDTQAQFAAQRVAEGERKR